MRYIFAFIVLLLLFPAGHSALAAKQLGVMQFRFVLEESCTSGAPGTFTSDGDITQPAGMGFSHVAGVITFDPANNSQTDTHEVLHQFPPFFDFNREPGTPQGVYPVLSFTGSCTSVLQINDDLTFTTHDGVCTSVGHNGPTSGVTTTIMVGRLRGQFAPDLQSFVATTLELVLEHGVDSNNNRFERFCGKNMQGVRISDK